MFYDKSNQREFSYRVTIIKLWWQWSNNCQLCTEVMLLITSGIMRTLTYYGLRPGVWSCVTITLNYAGWSSLHGCLCRQQLITEIHSTSNTELQYTSNTACQLFPTKFSIELNSPVTKENKHTVLMCFSIYVNRKKPSTSIAAQSFWDTPIGISKTNINLAEKVLFWIYSTFWFLRHSKPEIYDCIAQEIW